MFESPGYFYEGAFSLYRRIVHTQNVFFLRFLLAYLLSHRILFYLIVDIQRFFFSFSSLLFSYVDLGLTVTW